MVLSVKLDNPELAALAPPGTRVTLFATTSAEPVASHVLVVAIPAVDNGGILSSRGVQGAAGPRDAGRGEPHHPRDCRRRH